MRKMEAAKAMKRSENEAKAWIDSAVEREDPAVYYDRLIELATELERLLWSMTDTGRFGMNRIVRKDKDIVAFDPDIVTALKNAVEDLRNDA